MAHVLIVDDHSETLASLADLIEREGFTTSRAQSLQEARDELTSHPPDVILLDLNLPDGRGMSLLDEFDPASSPAVVLIGRLRAILADIGKTGGLKDEIAALKSDLPAQGRFGMLVGASPRMREVYDQIARVAPTNATVLIVGDSGTGKELVARSVHSLSRRRHGPFMAINCGAVSPSLIESELFGHERGSFTGADRRHKGVFEQATRGTLFLDEITEMPAELQVKLLRVLETGAFTRTGGETELSVDIRFIAATNRSPDEAVRDGRLREDLFYRLKVFQLTLPRLRDRIDDVEILAEQFLVQIAEAEGERKHLSPDAVALLREYAWPGNVRELKNAIYSAYIMASGDLVPACFPQEIRQPSTALPSNDHAVPVHVGMPLAEVERRTIVATLSHFDGSKTKTAEVLGISLKTLYNRLQEYRRRDRTPS
jgi:two-component system, NtrC family, response regulator AtoC